jgi:hypothetical protein
MDEDAMMKPNLSINRLATKLLTGKLRIAPPGILGPVVIAWGKGKMT